MKSLLKGGIWKNTEDEILKAAVVKYGPNQWSRISSLIVRKSAKECKARWYEWLDPRIKKTEWSREEEEKLLYLAKIFPSQWRTIAPIVGRTPAQCIEHYERLLDQAQGKDEMDENDPRKLRPGEIDPNPETKPPRPDPIDMDEDEKEMLQEARARLSNTRGKKAKRKEREKQLENAKRLSSLQKKRELKAAGIDYEIKRKIRGIDYNAEVPLERAVPAGRHAIENEQPPDIEAFKSGLNVQDLEGKRRDEEERRNRELDQARMKKMKEKDLPKAIALISKINDANTLAFKTKLILPQAQISDNELDQINKINMEREMMLAGSGNSATKALLGEITQREQTPLTMRTPMVQNSLMSEARRTHEIMNAPTPLVGGNMPNIESGMLTKKQRTIAATPNTLYQQSMRRPDSILRPKDTVRRIPPPGVETPMRGGFMNPSDGNDYGDSAWESNSLAFSVSEKQQKYLDLIESKKQKINLLQSFQSMPQPKNKYEVDLEELEQAQFEGMPPPDRVKIEDKEITDLRVAEEKRKQLIENLRINSYQSRTDIPKPSVIESQKINVWGEFLRQYDSEYIMDHLNGVSFEQIKVANELIENEMEVMMDGTDYDSMIQQYDEELEQSG